MCIAIFFAHSILVASSRTIVAAFFFRQLEMADADDLTWITKVPSPARAPIWASPYMPCYGAFSEPLNVRAPWGECEFTTRDRCDACHRPVCRVHGRRYWPHREKPPTRMAVAHRYWRDYINPATGLPFACALLCYDCQAVDLEGGEEFLPLSLNFIARSSLLPSVASRERLNNFLPRSARQRSRSPQRLTTVPPRYD